MPTTPEGAIAKLRDVLELQGPHADELVLGRLEGVVAYLETIDPQGSQEAQHPQG